LEKLLAKKVILSNGRDFKSLPPFFCLRQTSYIPATPVLNAAINMMFAELLYRMELVTNAYI